jgi:acyl-CoA synthetase (NDP forming)
MTVSAMESAIRGVVEHARAGCRDVLLEPEARELIEYLGIRLPRQVVVSDLSDLAWAAALVRDQIPGERVVVKVVAKDILHKSDVGGVRFVENVDGVLLPALEEMWADFAGHEPGLLVSEMIDYDAAPGGELLLGLRWTGDFGPVVTLALGGVATEFLAANLKPGTEIAAFAPGLTDRAGIEKALSGKVVMPLVTGGVRKLPARIDREALVDLIERLMSFAADWMPDPFREIEINPIVLTAGGPIALDALVKLGQPVHAKPARPIEKIDRLLHPRSAAVVGVSKSMNPGHVIVDNLIREGFERERIVIVKPGESEMEGCRCVPSIEAIPEKVDLLVLSIAAGQVPDAIRTVVEGELAESVIVIPGGLGEREGSEDLAGAVREMLDASRTSAWNGPIVNGGNCLGIRSRPGRYDTMFLPSYKVPHTDRPAAPLAFVSQSGAFTIAKGSKLDGIEPRYVVSIGNQIDLTVGDYMRFLEPDPEIEIFAFYVEGFQPGDGREWLEAASRAVRRGKTVILYRAGRTSEGAKASASHTAAIAGDFVVTRELARNAGIVVADSLEDFEDLVRLFVLMGRRRAKENRLGAVSNAGFEAVGIADNLGELTLATFAEATLAKVGEELERCRLERIVTLANPLDINPLMGDEAFAAVAEAVIGDEGVDLGVVGCVPLTGALQTLPPGEGHDEDIYNEHSVVSRLVYLWNESAKPWVAVVDSGRLYDPMARRLEECGVPTFRSVDRAMRLLGVWKSAT